MIRRIAKQRVELRSESDGKWLLQPNPLAIDSLKLGIKIAEEHNAEERKENIAPNDSSDDSEKSDEIVKVKRQKLVLKADNSSLSNNLREVTGKYFPDVKMFDMSSILGIPMNPQTNHTDRQVKDYDVKETYALYCRVGFTLYCKDLCILFKKRPELFADLNPTKLQVHYMQVGLKDYEESELQLF